MEKEVYRRLYEVQDTYWWHKAMRKFFNIFLRKYIGRNNKILDIGCGTGAQFPLLARYGEVWGVDISDEAVHYSRLRGVAREVLKADAGALPFASATFDAVVCSDLLYHASVADDQKVLAEIYRVLKPRGWLFLKEASYDWLRSRMDELVHTKHRFDKNELFQKLTDAGFTVVRLTHVLALLFPIALVARLSERIFSKTHDADALFKSNGVINSFLTFITFIEAFLLNYINFPFGLSLMAAAFKNSEVSSSS